jgi:hypothetical protein
MKKKIDRKTRHNLTSREKTHLDLNSNTAKNNDDGDVDSDSDTSSIHDVLMKDEEDTHSIDGNESIAGSVLSTESNISMEGSKAKSRKNKIHKSIIDKRGLVDVFEIDTAAVKDCINHHLRKIKEDEKYAKVICNSVLHFQAKMRRNVARLKVRMDEREEQISRSEEDNEIEVRLSIEKYIRENMDSQFNQNQRNKRMFQIHRNHVLILFPSQSVLSLLPNIS